MAAGNGDPKAPPKKSMCTTSSDLAGSFLTDLQPVISVDTKKKELVGNFKNGGREWRPKGTPEEVNVHDLIRSGWKFLDRSSAGHLSRHEKEGVGGQFQEWRPGMETQRHPRRSQCARLHRSQVETSGAVRRV